MRHQRRQSMSLPRPAPILLHRSIYIWPLPAPFPSSTPLPTYFPSSCPLFCRTHTLCLFSRPPWIESCMMSKFSTSTRRARPPTSIPVLDPLSSSYLPLEYENVFTNRNLFVAPNARKAIREGRADYVCPSLPSLTLLRSPSSSAASPR